MSVAIYIRRGATLVLPLDFFTDATETTALDLTGSTWAIVESNFPIAPGFTVLNATAGQGQLALSATNSATLVLNRNYELTLQQTQPSGNIALHGPFVFVAVDQ